jgi:hypothetical protein
MLALDHGRKMTIFDEMKPRSGKASANKRERDLARQLASLMAIEDEETLRKALEKDFGITAQKIPGTKKSLRFGATPYSACYTSCELLNLGILFLLTQALLTHVLLQQRGDSLSRLRAGSLSILSAASSTTAHCYLLRQPQFYPIRSRSI